MGLKEQTRQKAGVSTVGVAILGAGDIANVHIEAYKELAGRCRIVALADIYTDKAEAKKQKYGLDCDVVEDYK